MRIFDIFEAVQLNLEKALFNKTHIHAYEQSQHLGLKTIILGLTEAMFNRFQLRYLLQNFDNSPIQIFTDSNYSPSRIVYGLEEFTDLDNSPFQIILRL